MYDSSVGFAPPAPPAEVVPPVPVLPPPLPPVPVVLLLLPQAMDVSMSAAAPSPTMTEDRAPKFFMFRLSLMKRCATRVCVGAD